MSGLIKLLGQCRPGFLPTWLFWILMAIFLLAALAVALMAFWFVSTQTNML